MLLYRLLIELTNQKTVSLVLRKFSQSKISSALIPSFARVFKLNKEEMEQQIHTFETLHDLFIRKLKVDSRPIDQSPNSVVSPVDGVLEDIGTISASKLIEVKGKQYSIAEMLGQEDILRKYSEGTFIILYLSPSHYHRIHSPVSGVLTKQWTLGSKSYPVNKLGLKYGKAPLSKNYRTISEVKHDNGHVAIVKVGAMFVNSIETTHLSDTITKGEEIAYFSFGSTVVLLFEKDSFSPLASTRRKTEIRVGEMIGYLTKI